MPGQGSLIMLLRTTSIPVAAVLLEYCRDAGHSAKSFSRMISFNPHTSPAGPMFSTSPKIRKRNLREGLVPGFQNEKLSGGWSGECQNVKLRSLPLRHVLSGRCSW